MAQNNNAAVDHARQEAFAGKLLEQFSGTMTVLLASLGDRLGLFKELAQFNPAFLALNPKAVVPVLLHDDAVLIESTLICEYLEESFPSPDLPGIAARASARARMDKGRRRGAESGMLCDHLRRVASPHDLEKRCEQLRGIRYERVARGIRRATAEMAVDTTWPRGAGSRGQDSLI